MVKSMTKILLNYCPTWAPAFTLGHFRASIKAGQLTFIYSAANVLLSSWRGVDKMTVWLRWTIKQCKTVKPTEGERMEGLQMGRRGIIKQSTDEKGLEWGEIDSLTDGHRQVEGGEVLGEMEIRRGKESQKEGRSIRNRCKYGEYIEGLRSTFYLRSKPIPHHFLPPSQVRPRQQPIVF